MATPTLKRNPAGRKPAPQNLTGQPQPGQAPGGPVNGGAMYQQLQLLQQIQQQNADNRLGLVREVQQPGRHLGIGGGVMTPENPQGNAGGSLAQSLKRTTATPDMNYGTPVGVPGRTDQASNPYSFGGIGPGKPVGNPFITPTPNPTLHPVPGGGMEGMINPGAPDATKYSDANMFGIKPMGPNGGISYAPHTPGAAPSAMPQSPGTPGMFTAPDGSIFVDPSTLTPGVPLQVPGESIYGPSPVTSVSKTPYGPFIAPPNFGTPQRPPFQFGAGRR